MGEQVFICLNGLPFEVNNNNNNNNNNKLQEVLKVGKHLHSEPRKRFTK